MQIRQEELIAYLLGDAGPALRLTIEAALTADVQLRNRLRQLKILLGDLERQRTLHEPPSGLFERTMASIDQATDKQPVDEHAIDKQASKPDSRQVPQPAETPSVRLSCSLASVQPSRRSLWDSAGLSLSIAILACLFLPTILRARFESRRIQCSDNLRYLGEGLISLANLSIDQRFPAVPVEGPTAFSGIYAVYLNQANLLDNGSRLLCAGVPRTIENQGTTVELPSIAELQDALLCDRNSFEKWRRLAGGDYAYNLGVIESDQVVSPKSKGRAHFAILGDCPTVQGNRDEFNSHGRGALNILFEDGHVAFLAVSAWQDGGLDHPFRNQDGLHDVGMHINDASLAPSHFAPLAIRQALETN